MADYTFHSLVEPLKNNNTIQTILDIDALAAPAKAALAAYTASLGLPPEQTQHLLWGNVGIAIILESLSITYYLPSLGVQTPAPALKRTSTLQDKVIEMQALESKFPKCQILIFARTNAAGNWVWLNTEVIQNSGNRVNTLKLIPYLNSNNVFVPGRGTQIGIQFIADPVSNSTLPQAGDRVTVQGSIGLDVNPIGIDSKKNDEVERIRTQVAALELAIEGRLTNLSTSVLLGRASGSGTVEQIPMTTFATPAQVATAISQLIGGATQETLDTISELATAFGNNPNFATTVFDALASKAPLYSPNFSGYVGLGDNVATKKKLVKGTTAAGQGETTLAAHGIDSTKIIKIGGVVFFSVTGAVPIGTKQQYYSTLLSTDAANVRITNEAANSAAVLSKQFRVVIEYTE